MKKYRMLLLNEKHITYYYRLHAKDTITVGEKQGYFNRRKEGNPILSYFSEDHLDWPFNWMNLERSGAPNCKWIIRNDSIFLKEIGLLSSLSFDTVYKDIVSLKETFMTDKSINETFANLIEVVFLVEYGKEVERENLPGY